MSKLELFTNPMSRGQIAHWMLEEISQPYDTHWVEWGPSGNKSPEFMKINPMGKIPTLVHNGKVITEAAAICLYLADAFPSANLGPTTDERADYFRWTLFAAGPVEQAITNKSMGFEPPEGKQMMVGYGSYEKTISTLTDHFKNSDFVCGKRFTAADVYVGSAVIWGIAFKSIEPNNALNAYRDRLIERAAHKSCAAINNARTAQMKK